MIELPATALARPPEEGVRRIARGLLAAARAHLDRLERSDDPDALHDFRVTLRRLRSTLGIYREFVPAEPTRHVLRELGRLAASTNQARDAEVQTQWLQRQRRGLRGALRRAASHLLLELESRRPPAAAQEVKGTAFAAIEGELGAVLERYRLEVRLADATARPSFASSAARLLRAQAETLRRSLLAIRSADQREEPHRARIEAKRVRYLLEPVAGHVPSGRDLLERLRGLQDLLGEWNDLWLISTRTADAFEREGLARLRAQRSTAAQGDLGGARALGRRGLESALLALLAYTALERAERFAELGARWHGSALERFSHEIEETARELERAAGGSGRGVRTFLLHRLPAELEGRDAEQVEQGWLPGERVRERLSRLQGVGGERRLRAVELEGAGAPAVEEAVPAPVFRDLWPLTEGARLRLLRYAIQEQDLRVEIDSFQDRDLLLARVERAHGVESADPPAWLQASIEREVTDEAEFAPAKLAR